MPAPHKEHQKPRFWTFVNFISGFACGSHWRTHPDTDKPALAEPFAELLQASGMQADGSLKIWGICGRFPFLYLLASADYRSHSPMPWSCGELQALVALIALQATIGALYAGLRLAIAKIHWKLGPKDVCQHKDDLLRMAYLNAFRQ
ncbi:unnamed protein product [Effrenium voratum]|nr:unnamed protein product [Effrenium voratum]